MKKVRGFTLIELLIVVAIIAILAAIAVPNFLEAQVRAKVSSVKSDMRTMATAIESFQIDYNIYPIMRSTLSQTVHRAIDIPAGSQLSKRMTFADYQYAKVGSGSNSRNFTLTTPVAFIQELPTDAFADTSNVTFGYVNAAELGWMTWSYGPDGDEYEANGSDIEGCLRSVTHNTTAKQWTGKSGPATIYNPSGSNPTEMILKWATYDPTNGTSSNGDIWDQNG